MPTRKWKNEFLVNTTTAGNQFQQAVTALTDGTFVIAWHDDGPVENVIRYQRYDGAGVKIGAETSTPVYMPADYEDATDPALCALPNGGFWLVGAVTHSPGDADILGSFIGGDAPGFEHPANLIGNNQFSPAVASLGANGAVAVWYDATANGGDVMMSIVNPTHGTIASNVTVNVSTDERQDQPSVAATAAGDKFVVTWQDENSFGGEHFIMGRVFDANGNALTGAFFLSDTPGGAGAFVPAFFPTVACYTHRRLA
jgi:hypothetical protein